VDYYAAEIMTQQSKNAYLAGLLDGSGSFEASGQELKIIASGPRKIGKYLTQQFGGCFTDTNWTWRHEFSQPSAKTERLLLGILPYLIVQRDSANQALQLVRSSFKQKT
jgi:hypothetical protein